MMIIMKIIVVIRTIRKVEIPMHVHNAHFLSWVNLTHVIGSFTLSIFSKFDRMSYVRRLPSTHAAIIDDCVIITDVTESVKSFKTWIGSLELDLRSQAHTVLSYDAVNNTEESSFIAIELIRCECACIRLITLPVEISQKKADLSPPADANFALSLAIATSRTE